MLASFESTGGLGCLGKEIVLFPMICELSDTKNG